MKLSVIALVALASPLLEDVSAFSSSPSVLTTTRTLRTKTNSHVSKASNVIASSMAHSSAPKTALCAASADDEDGFFGGIQINFPYAIAYIGFLAFAFYMTTLEAPGASQAVLEKFLADPVNPGVNELFASVFNLLGLAAIPIACLSMPGAKGQKPPLVPFLLGGVFAGYGSIGIAMSTRKEVTNVSKEDLGWVTKNVLENKIFNWFVVALGLSTFYSTGLIDGVLTDAANQIAGYKELFSTTAIASASSCDLAILTLTAASLIPEDLKRRGVDDSSKATAIAGSTALLPIVGAAIYCALRPSLPEEKQS